MEEAKILKGAGAIFKDKDHKITWLLVRYDKSGDWVVPETRAAKKESSVSSIIRLMGESMGMRVRVLEEAGRSHSRTKVGNRTVHVSTIYYVIMYKAGEELLGFAEAEWFTLAQAVRKLRTQTEKKMLRNAQVIYKKWKKERDARRKKNRLLEAAAKNA